MEFSPLEEAVKYVSITNASVHHTFKRNVIFIFRLPGLLGPLQITLGDIYTQLKNLVQTFRLVLILRFSFSVILTLCNCLAESIVD